MGDSASRRYGVFTVSALLFRVQRSSAPLNAGDAEM